MDSKMKVGSLIFDLISLIGLLFGGVVLCAIIISHVNNKAYCMAGYIIAGSYTLTLVFYGISNIVKRVKDNKYFKELPEK